MHLNHTLGGMLRAKHHIIPLLCAAAMMLPVSAARAQAENPLCQTPEETIVTPYPAEFGVPAVWDATYKKLDALVQFAAGVPRESGTVMAWGRVLKPKTYETAETILVELNRRGRALTLKARPAKAGETPVDLVANGKTGFVAASNYWGGKDGKRGLARLSWYDDKGEYKSEKILQDDVFDYTLQRLVAVDGGGFFAILQAVNHRNEADQNGIILRYNRDGALQWRRAYRPGSSNQLQGLMRLPDGQYLATGSIRTAGGVQAGWAMKLSADGTIVWQRAYPRGAFAALAHGAVLPSARAPYDMLVAGSARPLDGDPDAAWVMAMDGNGEPLWQRYIRRPDYALSTLGLLTEEDGRITVGMNAEGVDEDGKDMRRDHVRLFTMTGRGVLISDEAYIDGIEAEGAVLFRGAHGERGVIGTIQSDSRVPTPSVQLAEALKKDDSAPESATPPPKPEEILQEGWVFLATALDIYDDPCLKRQ